MTTILIGFPTSYLFACTWIWTHILCLLRQVSNPLGYSDVTFILICSYDHLIWLLICIRLTLFALGWTRTTAPVRECACQEMYCTHIIWTFVQNTVYNLLVLPLLERWENWSHGQFFCCFCFITRIFFVC